MPVRPAVTQIGSALSAANEKPLASSVSVCSSRGRIGWLLAATPFTSPQAPVQSEAWLAAVTLGIADRACAAHAARSKSE